jgi:predicted dehydrogenase
LNKKRGTYGKDKIRNIRDSRNCQIRFIPAIRNAKNAEVLAVASRNSEKSRRYAEENGIETAYGSYEELLAQKDINAVYISPTERVA